MAKQQKRVPRGTRQDQLYGAIVRSMPPLCGKPQSIKRREDGTPYYTDDAGEHDYDPASNAVGAWLQDALGDGAIREILYEKFTNSNNLGVKMLDRELVDGYWVYRGIPAPDKSRDRPESEQLCGRCRHSVNGHCYAGRKYGTPDCPGFGEVE